jgi:hypothetical protein
MSTSTTNGFEPGSSLPTTCGPPVANTFQGPLPRPVRKRRKPPQDKGLPSDDELRLRATIFLEKSRETWPELAVAGIFPKPTEAETNVPIGRLPFGYTRRVVLDAQGKPLFKSNGVPRTERCIDPESSPGDRQDRLDEAADLVRAKREAAGGLQRDPGEVRRRCWQAARMSAPGAAPQSIRNRFANRSLPPASG